MRIDDQHVTELTQIEGEPGVRAVSGTDVSGYGLADDPAERSADGMQSLDHSKSVHGIGQVGHRETTHCFEVGGTDPLDDGMHASLRDRSHRYTPFVAA
jgi:hypothetical protein